MILIRYFLCFVLLFQLSEIEGKIRYVPAEYPKIQLAINSSQTGDTIIVSHGLYYENLVIKKNLVLGSKFIIDGDKNHISQTVIDGSKGKDPAKSSTILFLPSADTNCIITGLTIQGGRGTFAFIRKSPPPNRWNFGGGIAVLNAGARISHNIIRFNHLTENSLSGFVCGGGIGTLDTSWGQSIPPAVIIEDNLIVENTGYGELCEGGGIFLDQPGIIRYNTILHNKVQSRSRSNGGGIGLEINNEYKIHIHGNYIRYNSSGIGGGLDIGSARKRQGAAMVYNNIIADNRSFEVGGGIQLSLEAYAVFINNTIVRNYALSTGGAYYLARGSYAVLVNNIIWKNTPDQIANLSTTHSFNNLVEDGFPGRGNIDADPGFVPGDTLFRLAGISPCISAGSRNIVIAGEQVLLLPVDLIRMPRLNPANTNPDLGAVESLYGNPDISEQLQYNGRNIKLFISFRQITPPERNEAKGEILKAGEMAGYMQVNEERAVKIRYDEALSFELPPGENHIDLEIIARGRDSVKPLNLFVRLEGADQQVIPYNSQKKIFYNQWSNLKPGEYILRIQPQDDASIIGSSNRYAFAVTVLPYWYQRWWAYLLYGLGVVILAFVYTRMRIMNLKKEQDLALRKVEVQKLSELDKLKSKFFANVSHELRTPLTLILGPVDTLLTDAKDKNSKESLNLIRRNAYRLLRLVDLLLQYSRVEAGTMRLQVAKQNIVPVITRVVSYFASPAVKKNVCISINAQKEDITGYFDEEKIEHIVQNLLSNALKFTPGGGTITVSAEEEEGILKFTVSDTGIGIAKEDHEKIFDRFYRVENSHKTEGTGIGLSLTKEFIGLHHGTITLESEAGGGTTFTVTIPLSGYSEEEIGPVRTAEPAVIKAETESLRSDSTISISDAGDKQIILVAEDNDDTREYIASILRDKYDVVTSVDGTKALEETRIHLPDLVVSDVMMPDMDGYELCGALKTDERTCHIPVILLTALADRRNKLNGLGLGADDYLTKPFDNQELLVRIHNLLELRKNLREAFSHTEKLKPGDVPVVSLDDKFLQKVKKVAEKHISEEKFTVDQFAHEVFMSRVQFYRKLKAVTNLTPNDFLRILRLERARQLLLNKFGTISEVSEAVGFANQSYFARCFQSYFGILPHEVYKSQNPL